MTAGDEGRPGGGWVPTEPVSEPVSEPPSEHPPEPAPERVEPDTQPITRASLRRAREEAGQQSGQAWVATDAPATRVLALTTVATVALAALVGLSGLAGPESTAAAVAFTAVVMVWAWAPLTRAPSPRVGTGVLGVGVLVVCATVAVTRTEPYLVWVPVALAVSIIAAFLHQVLRRHGRTRLTDGVAAAVGALALTASGVALVPLPRYPHGGAWVLMAMATVAAAALPLGLTVRRLTALWGMAPAVVLGTAAAVWVSFVATGIPLVGALLVGVLGSAVSHCLQRVLLGLPGSRGAQAALGVGAASVLVAGVVFYLLARLYAS